MKKLNQIRTILLGVIYCCAMTSLSAKERDIQALLTTLECSASQNSSYIELVDHVIDNDAQTSVVRMMEHSLFRDLNLYMELHLNWREGQIVSGVMKKKLNESKLIITYQKGLLNSVIVPGSSFGKRMLEYNDKEQVVKVVQVEKLGSETERFYEIKYNEAYQISQILSVLSHPQKKKRALFSDKTFYRNGNECKTDLTMYSGIETRKFKQKVYKVEKGSFQVIFADRKYITTVERDKKESWTTEATYNERNQKVRLIDTNKNSQRTALNVIDNEYAEDLLIKSTTQTYVNDAFVTNWVQLFYKPDASSHKYIPLDKDDICTQGYSEDGELIHEMTSSKLRAKKDGVWGAWTYRRA